MASVGWATRKGVAKGTDRRVPLRTCCATKNTHGKPHRSGSSSQSVMASMARKP